MKTDNLRYMCKSFIIKFSAAGGITNGKFSAAGGIKNGRFSMNILPFINAITYHEQLDVTHIRLQGLSAAVFTDYFHMIFNL